MTKTSPLSAPGARWQKAKTLYPIYTALSREFVLEVAECPELVSGGDSPSQEAIQGAEKWLAQVDSHIQVHQLRQFLQTTTLTSESALTALLLHHLHQSSHSDSDRDKIDFLLVQLFSLYAPPQLDPKQTSMEFVAGALKSVLGETALAIPAWLEPLEGLIEEAHACQTLNALFTSRIIERGRKLKSSAENNYFAPVAMVAFTRFSYLMRRLFFRLMHQDLNVTLDGLRELERRGVATLDCRKAQFSAEEPVDRLRMICQSWRVMFQAEYSSGQALAMLVDLRSAVDQALAKSSKGSTPPPAKAKAAAAMSFEASAPETGEFEVSAGAPEPD